MDKEKLAKEASEIVRKFFLNDAYLPLLTEDWLETDFNRLSEKIADRIVIDWEDIEKIISPIALSAGINESWICSTMAEEIAEANPIKIKEADDEKT